MIDRYQTPEMKEIWSEQNKYNTWLEIEILAAEAWSHCGKVPMEDAKKIRQNAKVDAKRVAEIEEVTRHDVVAFTRAVSESLGDEKKWIHYGLTSTDVVDTANGYLLKEANECIEQHLRELIALVASEAKHYQHAVCIGRTHGIHAEVTTFGLKLALFYDELNRRLQRFCDVRKEVEVGQLSGAVGTYSNIPLAVEEEVCQKMGLHLQNITTQVSSRDRYAEYISTLALIATTLERFAMEWRHLQRTEVQELEENFAKGQKGSSAMPHKRNPISAENLCGIARIIRGYITPAYEDVLLWHERDISHSSAERLMLPDATSLLNYMIVRLTNMIKNWRVRTDKMEENIQKTHGLVFSQNILLKLIDKGLSREEAYDLIQPLAMQSFETGEPYIEILKRNNQIQSLLTSQELEVLFDPKESLQHVDDIFKRVGLVD